jgi:hypothetical protein
MKEGVLTVHQEEKATGPGIVVLSSSLQVLHINRRAMALLTQLERTAQSIGAELAVAAPLHQHCQNIVEILQARLASNNWEQFHQYRTIGDSPHTILLKGFGLPDRMGLAHSRIVMLLSPHTLAPLPGISRRESLNGISKSSQLGADSPRATNTHHA